MAVLHNIYCVVLLGLVCVVSSSDLLYMLQGEPQEEAEVKAPEEGSETFIRQSRSPTCGCCVQSRMTNLFCCDLCTKVAKRSQPDPVRPTQVMYPSVQKKMSSNCFCCKTAMNRKCCQNCRYFL